MPKFGLPQSAVTLLFLCSTALAQPDLPSRDGASTTPAGKSSRPRIEDYADQDSFVADLLAWKRQRKRLQQRSMTGNHSGNAEQQSSDWHHVTGPEDLETALRNAQGYQQPHYRTPLRYNRTTHISFPLPHLRRGQMAQETIKGLGTPPPLRVPIRDIPDDILEQTQEVQRLNVPGQRFPLPTTKPVSPQQVSNVRR